MFPAIPKTPIAVRCLPFVVFVLLTALQGQFGAASAYWIYILKTGVGAWMVASVWRSVPEYRWTFSPVAVLAGAGVFGLWVGLDGFYPTVQQLFSKSSPASASPAWNPHLQFGQGSAVAWGVVAVRILGGMFVVPPIEEAFYRSFLYRAIERSDFLAMPLSQFALRSLVITAAVFGFAHQEWLPGILCGLAYQGLVLRKGHLGEAMAAHAVTNGLLGVYVVWRGAWHFW